MLCDRLVELAEESPPMKLSGHEINSQLRQKLDMPTGRHLYVVLGTYERIERYERVAFREARWPGWSSRLARAAQYQPLLTATDSRRRVEVARPKRGWHVGNGQETAR